MLSLKEKVANGVKWLDENHEGWKKKINISILNMIRPEKCIIGQIFKDYYQTEKILGVNFCREHGFTTNHGNFDSLTTEWLEVLEETYNLSTDKVKPGFYKVIDTSISFNINEILLVIDPHEKISIKADDYENIFNYVVDSNYRMFVNCPVIVKKSETGF
jgi:hypothetical protein